MIAPVPVHCFSITFGRDQTHEMGMDPDYIIKILLNTGESLIERFIQHQCQLPGIQSKITEQMTTAATVEANGAAVSANHSDGEKVSIQTATTHPQSTKKLAVPITKLHGDLAPSNQRCDELEK